MVDKRFGTSAKVEELINLATESRKTLNLFDVDAPLTDSLIGVLRREPGGKDPIVPFEELAEGGFLQARGNRKDVIDLFRNNPQLGRYELYGSIGDGQKALVASVVNGKLKVFNPKQFDELVTNPTLEIDKIRNTVLDSNEISRVTSSLSEGSFKNEVTQTLRQFEGKTWEQAILEHGKSRR